MDNFIDDGYTLDDVIEPHPQGLHQGMVITFRPINGTQLSRWEKYYTQGSVHQDLEKAAIVQRELVAAALVEWNQGRPINIDNVRQINRFLFQELWEVVAVTAQRKRKASAKNSQPGSGSESPSPSSTDSDATTAGRTG